MITYRQRDLLEFIASYQDKHGGVSPSYREMAAALKVKSPSGVHGLIVELIDRGYVRKLPERHRSIEILKRPTSGLNKLGVK